MRIQFLLIFAVLSPALLFPGKIQADHLIKKIKHTSEINFKGEITRTADENSETWISKKKLRQDLGNHTTVILRFDQKKIYHINHKDRTFSVMGLPLNPEKHLPPETRQISQMMEMSTTVTKISDEQRIEGWACQKYSVDAAISLLGMDIPIKIEIWVSKATGIDLKSYKKIYKALLSMNPFTSSLVRKFRKIGGYPVLTVITMNIKGSKTNSKETVLSIEGKKAPKGIYDIPEGFKLVDYVSLDSGSGPIATN